MDALLNTMRRQAERTMATRATTRIGTITSYDPVHHAVKVMLQPDETETGFIPLAAAWVGNGWGVFFAPIGDEQVVVEFQEGSHETPIATLRLYDNTNQPLPVPAGEMWLVHQTGSYLKLTTDGKITLNAAAEIDVGNIGTALHTLLTDSFMAKFNNHQHTSAGSGSPTSVPLAPNMLVTSDFTTVLRAN